MKGSSHGYDDGAANRFTDPSAGSFSYYRGHDYKAKREITAGEEIFTGGIFCFIIRKFEMIPHALN